MVVSDSSSRRAGCAGVKKRPADLVSGGFAWGAGGAVSTCCFAEAKAGNGSNDAPRTVAEHFNHWRRSCLKSIGSRVDMAPPYRFPLCNSSARYSQERQHNAMMLQVGCCTRELAKALPSTTNKFLTACDC